MNNHDKGWADLKRSKPGRVHRLFKAVHLFLSTNYSWDISWHVAAGGAK